MRFNRWETDPSRNSPSLSPGWSKKISVNNGPDHFAFHCILPPLGLGCWLRGLLNNDAAQKHSINTKTAEQSPKCTAAKCSPHSLSLPLSSAELQDWKVLNHRRRCVFYLSGGSRGVMGGRVRMAMDSRTAPDTSCDANSLTGKRSGGRRPGPDSRSVFRLKPYAKDSLMTSLLRFMQSLDRPSITHMVSWLQPAANGKPIHHRGSGCSKLRPHSWLQGHQVKRWGSNSYWLPPLDYPPLSAKWVHFSIVALDRWLAGVLFHQESQWWLLQCAVFQVFVKCRFDFRR